MLFSRRMLMQQRHRAYAARDDQTLPQDLRNMAKTAGDQADTVLGMQDAAAKKMAEEQNIPLAGAISLVDQKFVKQMAERAPPD